MTAFPREVVAKEAEAAVKDWRQRREPPGAAKMMKKRKCIELANAQTKNCDFDYLPIRALACAHA